MTLRKLQKAKERWKDYKKKRNIIRQEIKELQNGTRKRFSVLFPKSRKYVVVKKEVQKRPEEIKTTWWRKLYKFITNLFKRYVEKD